MPTADCSNTERIRRIHCRMLARFRSEYPNRREECPPPTRESTYLDRRIGQSSYVAQLSSGARVTVPGCCGK